jgi:hypothetical protein
MMPDRSNSIMTQVWRIFMSKDILLGHLLYPSDLVGIVMFSLVPYPLIDGKCANLWHVGLDYYKCSV